MSKVESGKWNGERKVARSPFAIRLSSFAFPRTLQHRAFRGEL